MLLEFSLDIHLVWAEGNAAGLQGSTSGMRERVRVPTNYAPMFLNMRCGPTILRTWADNYLEASPGKAGHLAYIQVVVVCTLESRIPIRLVSCPFDLAAGTQDGDPEPHQPGPRAHAGGA